MKVGEKELTFWNSLVPRPSLFMGFYRKKDGTIVQVNTRKHEQWRYWVLQWMYLYDCLISLLSFGFLTSEMHTWGLFDWCQDYELDD